MGQKEKKRGEERWGREGKERREGGERRGGEGREKKKRAGKGRGMNKREWGEEKKEAITIIVLITNR